MADGTLFGLVRDIGDRRKAARVRDVMRQNNYFNDPMAAIQAVNDAGYLEQAVALRDQEAARQAALAKQRNDIQKVDSERYRGALLGITQGLRGVRDQGGDLGGALDQLSPILQRGFGMAPAEIAELKGQLTANPGIIDSFEEMFADPTKAKFGVVTPGGAIYNQRTGEITGNNPAAPRAIKMRRGDGGEDLYIVDENGQFVPAGVSSPGTASGNVGGAPVMGNANLTGGTLPANSRGMRNGNPGNIKDGQWARKQPGYIGSDGTFARFATPEAGLRAQENLLRNHYVNGKRSINEIVDKYLGDPKRDKENSAASRENYKRYVAQRLGMDRNVPVDPGMLSALGQSMREFETGVRVQGAGPGGGGVRPVASTPGKPQGSQGWRDLTTEEKAARGLPTDRAYQIGLSGANTGKITSVGGQPTTGKAGKPAGTTIAAHNAALTGLTKLRDQTTRLLNHKSFSQATGVIQGRLPSVFQGSKDFDAELQSYKDSTVLNALRAMKEASPNGASGFGSLQLKEGERLENSTGPLDQSSPDTLRRTLANNRLDAMISIGLLFNIRPEAVKMLVQNPALAKAFDDKYGKGMARKITGR